MSNFALHIGWPHKDLWPNRRVDRRSATATRAAARTEGWAVVKEAKRRIPADAHLDIAFHKANRGRFDLDGALGAIKSHLDGMAKASGVDDEAWTFTLRKGAPKPGGGVTIIVNSSEPQAVIVPLVGKVGA